VLSYVEQGVSLDFDFPSEMLGDEVGAQNAYIDTGALYTEHYIELFQTKELDPFYSPELMELLKHISVIKASDMGCSRAVSCGLAYIADTESDHQQLISFYDAFEHLTVCDEPTQRFISVLIHQVNIKASRERDGQRGGTKSTLMKPEK
jgi:hypothetical protein